MPSQHVARTTFDVLMVTCSRRPPFQPPQGVSERGAAPGPRGIATREGPAMQRRTRALPGAFLGARGSAAEGRVLASGSWDASLHRAPGTLSRQHETDTPGRVRETAWLDPRPVPASVPGEATPPPSRVRASGSGPRLRPGPRSARCSGAAAGRSRESHALGVRPFLAGRPRLPTQEARTREKRKPAPAPAPPRLALGSGSAAMSAPTLV